MAPYILILAHLAGDFLFQPGKLVAWKKKSVFGVLAHVLIILGLNVVLFAPYLNQAVLWIALGIVAVTHFVQDCIKVFYEKNFNKKKKSYPFFIDQFLHLLVIFFIGSYLSEHLISPEIGSNFLSRLYFNENLYLYTAFLILFSYALDIVFYQIKRHKNPEVKYERHYDDMAKRVFAFAVIYAIFLIVSWFL